MELGLNSRIPESLEIYSVYCVGLKVPMLGNKQVLIGDKIGFGLYYTSSDDIKHLIYTITKIYEDHISNNLRTLK